MEQSRDGKHYHRHRRAARSRSVSRENNEQLPPRHNSDSDANKKRKRHILRMISLDSQSKFFNLVSQSKGYFNGGIRRMQKINPKTYFLVAMTLVLFTSMQQCTIFLLGRAHSIRGGSIGSQIDIKLKRYAERKAEEKVMKRKKKLERMREHIEERLERDVNTYLQHSQIYTMKKISSTAVTSNPAIPRHILLALSYGEMQEQYESLLNQWSFYLNQQKKKDKLRTSPTFALNKLTKIMSTVPSTDTFDRVLPFDVDFMRQSLSGNEVCKKFHSLFLVLPRLRDKISLWSICDLYWYGGAFVGDEVTDVDAPLHEIFRVSEDDSGNVNGPVGCVIMRPAGINGTDTSISTDLAMVAMSPRHPALLDVIEKLSGEELMQRLVQKGSNPTKIIADLFYDVIATQVGTENLIKQVQNGGGVIEATGDASGSWILLTEVCVTCGTSKCCKVYDGRRRVGFTEDKEVDAEKDFGRVVMTIKRDSDHYVDKIKHAKSLDMAVDVTVRESEGTPQMELVKKKPLQEIMIKKGCEPSQFCNQCLKNPRQGSFSSCSSVCDECYEYIICSPPAPSKDVHMEVVINVEKKNKDEKSSSQLIPRIIHQTWFEELTPDRYPQLIRIQNSWIVSGWEYRFYDDAAARKFIADNFPDRFVYAYDSLIPGAYKADFFRYLVLLKSGGVYADIDVMLETNIDSLAHPDLSFFVPLDEPGFEGDERFCLWNGLMGASPGHPFMVRAVERSLNMILNRADAFDVEQEMCQISGREMEYWKTRLIPVLIGTGPCGLGIAVNEALKRGSMDKFLCGLMKANGNGYHWDVKEMEEETLNFHILAVRIVRSMM